MRTAAAIDAQPARSSTKWNRNTRGRNRRGGAGGPGQRDDGRGIDGRGEGGQGIDGRRMVHRLYLPFTTCLDVPTLTENPFRTPDELYNLLTGADLELRFTDTIRVATPTGDDTTSLHVPPGGAVLITRRLTTDTHGRTLALEETRRNAEDTQLTYPLAPTELPARLSLQSETRPVGNVRSGVYQ